MQTVTTIGLEIAKSVFQLHGIDEGSIPKRLLWDVSRYSARTVISSTPVAVPIQRNLRTVRRDRGLILAAAQREIATLLENAALK